MGKLAGAALTAVAPEAKVASAAASAGRRRRARKSGPGPLRHQPTNLNGLSPQDREKELQARKADAKWAAQERAAGRDPDRGTDPAPAPADPPPASPGGGPSLPSLTISPAAQTGSGFLLGLFLWGWVGLPYLRGGGSEVRRTLAAKFLNKTSQGGRP